MWHDDGLRSVMPPEVTTLVFTTLSDSLSLIEQILAGKEK